MIIISSDIVLSEVAAEDPNAGQICYQSYLNRGSVSSDEAQLNYPITNLATPATHLLWKGETADEQHITINAGLNIGADYVAFANHNFGSKGIAYQVQGSDDESTWEDIGDLVIPNDDSPHIQIFPLTVFNVYRIKLTPSGDTPPQAAIVYIGKKLAMQRRSYVGVTPLTMGLNTQLSNNVSERGHFLGRIVKCEFIEASFSWENLKPAWYRQYFDPFVRFARTQPFFYAWRPVDYPLEVGFVWTNGRITPKNQRPNGMMEVEMKVQGISEYILESSQVDSGLSS